MRNVHAAEFETYDGAWVVFGVRMFLFQFHSHLTGEGKLVVDPHKRIGSVRLKEEETGMLDSLCDIFMCFISGFHTCFVVDLTLKQISISNLMEVPS